jgi:hypothetical protein
MGLLYYLLFYQLQSRFLWYLNSPKNKEIYYYAQPAVISKLDLLFRSSGFSLGLYAAHQRPCGRCGTQ